MARIALALVLGYFLVFVLHLASGGISSPWYELSAKKERRTEPKVLQYYEPKNQFPFPIEHARKLYTAGLSFEEILRIATVYEKYKRKYAFLKASRPIPNDAAYLLARHVSIVIESVDPWILIAILRLESEGGEHIGSCRFYVKRKAPRSFRRLIAKTRRVHSFVKISYPVVAYSSKGGCGDEVGIFQIRAWFYLRYEPEIRRLLGVKHFLSPWHYLPSFFVAAAILRDIAKVHGVLPANVTIENLKLCRKVAATYNAGRNWRYHVGKRKYGYRACKLALKLSKKFRKT
ncbi:hypothetical protein IIA95_02295 [Patescibacteria group bacterium]|nr:hypothetical protein [Patescibacteria group bacterium]